MLEREVRVVNPLGLHARAAAQLVRAANEFTSAITLVRDDTGVSADAKSILSVLYVAAGKGASIKVIVQGEDESTAMERIAALFESGFGELDRQI